MAVLVLHAGKALGLLVGIPFAFGSALAHQLLGNVGRDIAVVQQRDDDRNFTACHALQDTAVTKQADMADFYDRDTMVFQRTPSLLAIAGSSRFSASPSTMMTPLAKKRFAFVASRNLRRNP